MKRLSGFSLMEMMTVLLIVSIVAAATAPMINKKMMTSANNDCPWVNVNNGIAYNTDNGNRTVNIGTDTRNDLNPRLNIRTDNVAPQITLEDNQDNTARLLFRNGSFGFTNSRGIGRDCIAIGGADVTGQNSIAIGSGGTTNNGTNTILLGNSTANEGSIVIGNNMTAASNSIAISNHSNVQVGEGAIFLDPGGSYNTQDNTQDKLQIKVYRHAAPGAIAIGDGTNTSENSIAIGNNARTSLFLGSLQENSTENSTNAIAIGDKATATCDGSIAIGSYSSYPSIDGAINNTYSTSVGSEALAKGHNSTAIGYKAKAISESSTAIGAGAKAYVKSSTAIGAGAMAKKTNQIVLGTENDTVYIPGNLRVDGIVELGVNKKSYVAVRINEDDNQAPDAKWNVFSRLQFKSEDYADHHILVTKYGNDGQYQPTLSSDRRLKNVGETFKGGLAELKKLDLFHYTYKKDKSNTPHVGVIAQDLQKVFPDAVTKGDDGFLRIRMEDMFYALINAVKELAGMFDKQDEKIVQLEKENKQLQKTVADLEKQNKDILKRLEKLERQK